ncbi:nucleoside-diphosphate-sugar epimerase [Pontibacter aydingkolensis]|uniref:NAD-dependent epimerase/dehydratase family protein n=1 Tax=Pontibacter aydingkolensis TaxID=1911536 RepID=A0ABS7CQ18_9BACT|nr:NAD-dependent epimerase/dehydratase family protein [Pontibacter aydingkolensis]MBW7465796.1 NAD-dependent epimerase/dehydratase family protein [Pontibacter aydingkolensis]
MTVFVTGGSGLIGSFLIPALLDRGYAIKASYRNHIPPVSGKERVQWLEGDILDPLFLREALQGVSYVFHCAGLVSYAPQDKDLLKQVNIEGTVNVVNACLEQGNVKLCHVSSIAAIGRPKGVAILTEKDKFDVAEEHSAYASSKYFGELEVWRGISEGLKAVIVNPSVILGPADWHRSSTQLFKYVYNEKPFYTEGGANFVDVRDVAEAMLQLMFSDISGERFILNAEQLSYKDFFTAVAKCFGKKAPGIKVPRGLAEVVWRAERVRTMFTGGRPLITKETARITGKQHFFSNDKVLKATGIGFRPVYDSVEWVCRELKNTAQKGG